MFFFQQYKLHCEVFCTMQWTAKTCKLRVPLAKTAASPSAFRVIHHFYQQLRWSAPPTAAERLTWGWVWGGQRAHSTISMPSLTLPKAVYKNISVRLQIIGYQWPGGHLKRASTPRLLLQGSHISSPPYHCQVIRHKRTYWLVYPWPVMQPSLLIM